MLKEFNTTGWCNPDRHYMADISKKVEQVLQMIYRGNYFIISRPRQYGKTTLLKTLDNSLSQSEEWLVFSTSFEGLGSEAYLQVDRFCHSFLHLLYKQTIEKEEKQLAQLLEKGKVAVKTLSELSDFITQLVHASPKKLVLLIDEVDKGTNNELFLDFLGVLRTKYLDRDLKTEQTFHSVILTGVHDIKNLKLKLRPDTAIKRNSPWNIATDFKVAMELQVAEIIPMLEEYAQDYRIKMDSKSVAEKLFYYTSGYPFLVSQLCKILVEDILPKKKEKELTSKEVTQAAEMLIQTSNVNFDSLKKNLLNNEQLYELVFEVAVNNEPYPFTVHDPLIELGLVYGIFRKNTTSNNLLSIHNRIYAEVIYDFMSWQMLRKIRAEKYNSPQSYLLDGQQLNIEKVLLKFQEFQRESFTKHDRHFLERQGRLIFLAFLKPILNGGGFSFKEPQISEEKRLDIAITFYQHQYVVELKIWKGAKAHQKGLLQLADYLEKQSLTVGYLLIFDQRVKKSWAKEWVKVGNKRIFAIWV